MANLVQDPRKQEEFVQDAKKKAKQEKDEQKLKDLNSEMLPENCEDFDLEKYIFPQGPFLPSQQTDNDVPKDYSPSNPLISPSAPPPSTSMTSLPSSTPPPPYTPPNRPPASRPMDIPVYHTTGNLDNVPPTPMGQPDNLFEPPHSSTQPPPLGTTTVIVPLDPKVTEGFDVDFPPLPSKNQPEVSSSSKKQTSAKKPVMKVAPLLPEDPLPELNVKGLSEVLNSTPSSSKKAKPVKKVHVDIENAWTEEEIAEDYEYMDMVKTAQFLVQKNRWEIETKNYSLDQLCKETPQEKPLQQNQQFQDQKNSPQVSEEPFDLFLSQRTVIRVTKTRQLEFEIGPLDPDPDHVNAVVKFPVNAFKHLKEKMTEINKILKNPQQGKTVKRHLINQWYVEIQPSTPLSPYAPFWVNLLSINRKGETSYRNSVFLKGDEWEQLCFYADKISLNLQKIKVPLPGEQKCVPKQALMYTYKSDRRTAKGELCYPEQRYFFAPEHALESAKRCFGDMYLTLDDLKMHSSWQEILCEPPCINTFLLDCFMFYLFTKLCNYHLQKEQVQGGDKCEAFHLITALKPQAVVNFMTKNMEFPQKYLEQCFLQYHLNCGLPFPATGSFPYIQALKKYVRLHTILENLFYWDGPNYGSIDMEYGTPNHYLRREVYYMMFPEEEAVNPPLGTPLHSTVYKVSEKDMYKMNY